MIGRIRLQRFLSIFCNSPHIYHVRHYKPNDVSVRQVLDSKQLGHIVKMTEISSIQLCEIQRTLCFVNGDCEFLVNMIQRNLPVHFSTTESVISLWMIMQQNLYVSSLYYAPKCIKKPLFQIIECERAQVWNIVIIITLWYIFLVSADDDEDDDDGDDDDDPFVTLRSTDMTTVRRVWHGLVYVLLFPLDAFDPILLKSYFIDFQVPLYSLFHRRSLGSFYMNIWIWKIFQG